MPEYGSGSNPGQRGQYAGIRGQLGWNKQSIKKTVEELHKKQDK